MNYPAERKQFNIQAIALGWQVPADIPLGFQPTVPTEVKERWLKRLLKRNEPRFSETPRLVQHFTIGADPEFVLLDPIGTQRLDGSRLGLRTGMAYGVDSNGRLLEIRPEPSRSALEVLASILVTLRWFSINVPTAVSYQWRAGAFVLRDGLGGHIHLGRKTAQREREVEALDRVYHVLNQQGVFPSDECTARRAGDQFGQRYGQDGDIRMQNHGYEYRTLPSWLDSPLMAYLCLVLGKLVAHDPEPFREIPKTSKQGGWNRVLNLLRKYEGLDDDARILLWSLEKHGLPKFVGGDFKGRWGISGSMAGASQVEVIPASIKPTVDEMKEMFCHLVNKSPLVPGIPKPYWVTKVPKGYVLITSYTDTSRRGGNFGEVLNGLVVPEDFPIRFEPSDVNVHLMLSGDLVAMMSPDWGKVGQALGINIGRRKDARTWIGLSREVRENKYTPRLRRLLTSGVFPIWTVETVKESSWTDWRAAQKPPKKPNKVLSKILLERKT
jgi:hypothetical protein